MHICRYVQAWRVVCNDDMSKYAYLRAHTAASDNACAHTPTLLDDTVYMNGAPIIIIFPELNLVIPTIYIHELCDHVCLPAKFACWVSFPAIPKRLSCKRNFITFGRTPKTICGLGSLGSLGFPKGNHPPPRNNNNASPKWVTHPSTYVLQTHTHPNAIMGQCLFHAYHGGIWALKLRFSVTRMPSTPQTRNMVTSGSSG
jgi:hypothetical protein